MSKSFKVGAIAIGVIAGLGLLHIWQNVGFENVGFGGANRVAEGRKFRVGFLPVTCHLTCPVTDWINENMVGESFYEPVRFSAFPEMKEALVSGYLDATFMIAPLALALREGGVPVKIVYLGHRDGTALMVHKESNIYSFKDLKGKKIAIPNRYSNQHLIVFKGLKDNGLSTKDVTILEMPPPDMPAALASKAVDAIIAGEPLMAKTELDGYGRVLFQAKDLWPNFISCVLVAPQRTIDEHPEWLQQLVDGVAKSGKWLEASMEHRMQTAEAVGPAYYNQDPRLLRFVLSTPPDRVTYVRLMLAKEDFRRIEELAAESGILKKPLVFEEYTDLRFSEKTAGATAYNWDGPKESPK
jgi:NitT/TauT family transport system substrate-binding protein